MGRKKESHYKSRTHVKWSPARRAPARSNTVTILLLSVSLAALSVTYVCVTSLLNAEHELSFNVTGTVPVKILDSPLLRFAEPCAEAALPVVLRNSVPSMWRARHWTPGYLEKKLDSLSGVYENSNRWFGPYFDQNKPLVSSAKRINDYKTDQRLSAKEFFHRIQHPVTGSYLYFTSDIDKLGEWALGEINPVKELLSLNPRKSSINIWIGQPHVVAHCHYDGYHNFYAQLYGRKRFRLVRPTHWPGLYPYPFLHPSHAQAQVNVSREEDRQSFPLVGEVEAQEVILGAGDLLYIPPLWFHEVESLDVSISVNVWTDSNQTQVVEQIFQVPFPIHAIDWSASRSKRVGVSMMVLQVLLSICARHMCTRPTSDKFRDQYFYFQDNSLLDSRVLYFIHQLWSTRYRALMEMRQLPDQLPPELGEKVLCEGRSPLSALELAQVREAKVATSSTNFENYSWEVGKKVQNLPSDSWELWVGNYVEFVVANVLPDAKYTGTFLKHFSSCLHIE